MNRNLSWPNLKIAFFALSHQLHTPRYQLSLRTTTLMWDLLIEHQTQSQWHSMQSLIGILSSVFSILWGALASAASRKKRCLSVEIRGWLDNGPRLPGSAPLAPTRVIDPLLTKRLHQEAVWGSPRTFIKVEMLSQFWKWKWNYLAILILKGILQENIARGTTDPGYM